MWANASVFYQIYPLGFCGAPAQQDGQVTPRIRKVLDWIPHLTRLHCDAVYFCPVFQSDAHGYDTQDFRVIDPRLGTKEDFAQVCHALHDAGIRVVLDGVFNHVGRGFWAFQDVLARREQSPYQDWFFLNLGGNNGYNDGLWYEGWEGHEELVKLNLRNGEAVHHLLDCVRGWIADFDIDGLRLDVAYSLDLDFMRQLRSACDGCKPDFFLVGEMLHGDYNRLLGEGLLDSVTNYECYKGLHSSFNSMNLFEITHSLLRQFGSEPWTLYKGQHLLCFADNHDVTRIASLLQNPRHLPLLYALLFAMPGIPCLYYGSEWGVAGVKQSGSDASLRPCLESPVWNDLSEWVARCAQAHRQHPALWDGSFRSVLLTNGQAIWERRSGNERILIAINATDAPYTAHFDAQAGRALDLLTGQPHDFGGGSVLPPYHVAYWLVQ